MLPLTSFVNKLIETNKNDKKVLLNGLNHKPIFREAIYKMSRVIGIDLGTTYTCVSILEGGQPRILENSEGSRITPSMVAFTNKGKRLVGQPAKRQMVTNPENTLLAIKRIMGRRYESSVTQDFKNRVAFDVIESANQDAWVRAGGKEMSPSEVSAVVLQKMKQTAELFLGEDVTQAVITVPAYFSDAQRQATRDAGRIAGLEVLRIVNEPTAAALAFGLDKTEGKTIAVYDLGGGTFDISILEVNNGVFQVKATNGDTYLGGVDFDHCVVDYILETFENDHSIDLSQDRIAMQRIREAAENMRIELSSVQQADINLPFIYVGEEGAKHLSLSLTRDKLEDLVDHLIQRTILPCQTALMDAGCSRAAVDDVILVGGMTRMPKVQQTVAQLFGKEPHRGVNPDEVVAMGAAIQGGVLAGELHNILLLDVTPFSLGIRTKGGGFSTLIEKNEPIPCKITRTFTTAQNWQTRVTVMVAQGQEKIFENNTFLGEFELDGLPIALKGTPKVDVTFFVDVDGMVQVSARDRDTDREQSMRVKISGGLAEEEIQRLSEEAGVHAKEEGDKILLLDNRNRAESLMDRAGHFIDEHEAVLENDLVDIMKESIAALRSGVETEEDSLTMIARIEALQGWFEEAKQALPEQDSLADAVSMDDSHEEDVLRDSTETLAETSEAVSHVEESSIPTELFSDVTESAVAEETLAETVESVGVEEESLLADTLSESAEDSEDCATESEITESCQAEWKAEEAVANGESSRLFPEDLTGELEAVMADIADTMAAEETVLSEEEEEWMAMAS